MINKNNKNFQITLDPESATILETLAARFKTSKSIIIRNTLKVYAGKKMHSITLKYSTFLEVEQTEQKPSSKNEIDQEVMSDEEFQKMMEFFKNPEKEENDDPDKLPF